ncbi:MAG: ANTAR domain-containing protein [Bacilli bacterium]|nr:ANTAR domain-containing protein [Bacilli bacterium]
MKLRINRILVDKNFPFTITDQPIRKDDLLRYDIVIIHSSYHITDLYGFVENAVLKQLSHFVYITSNVGANPYRKLSSYTNIVFVDENRMDIELPIALHLIGKYAKEVQTLKAEKLKIKQALDEMSIMSKCKRYLMKTGLSEEEAHQHILKYAMDNHLSKYDACNRLLADNSE